MSRALRAAVALALLGPAPGLAQEAAAPATPAANLAVVQPCGTRAARYEGPKGFTLFATRIGRATVENPLRPLTPEVTQVLQVTIGAKLATAYGPDLAALRRGGTVAALEAQLGAPVRWEASLPTLPDPLAIVGEDGAALATLAFRECTEPPAAKAAPAAARKGGPGARQARGAGRGGEKAPKTPPGFSLPQGAIAE